jgi:hypothetical protein
VAETVVVEVVDPVQQAFSLHRYWSLYR